MPSLWSTLLERWLDTGPPPEGIDHLCEHLRRDIGIADGGHRAVPPESIQARNLSEARIFCSLPAYR